MWRKLSVGLMAATLLVSGVAISPKTADALTVSPLVLEYDLAPGKAAAGTITLRNEGSEPETYYSMVKDFVAGDEAGSPSFVEKSSARSLVDWVGFSPKMITLGPGESAPIVFNLTVPKTAAPGGYYGGLLFSTSAPTDTKGVGAVGATGPLLLVRVSGNVIEKGTISHFTASPDSSTSLPITFNVRFENTGTTHLKPSGVIRVRNMFGGVAAVIPVNQDGRNVLPSSARQFQLNWQKALSEPKSELAREIKNFGFGPYTADLVLTYGETGQVTTASTTFWVMPWMLVFVFLLALVVLAILIAQYNKWIIANAMKNQGGSAGRRK